MIWRSIYKAFQSPYRYFLWAGIAATILLLTNLIMVFGIQDLAARRVFSDILSPINDSLAAAGLLLAAWYSYRTSKRLGLAWGLLGLAQLATLLGDILWAVYELGLNQSPFPSIADGAYLAYYPLFVLGVFYLPARKFSQQEWIKTIIDMLVVMIGAFLIFWNFLIGPLAVSGSEKEWLVSVLTMAYPIGDLVLLWAALLLLYHRTDFSNDAPLLILTIGLLCAIFADGLYSFEVLSETYASGNITDFGLFFGYMLFGFAGIWQAVAIRNRSESRSNALPAFPYFEKIHGMLVYLPYLGLGTSFALVVFSHSHPLPMDFLTLSSGVGVVIGLILIRQIIMLNENTKLTRQLQGTFQKLQRQASDLERINRDLQVEILERKRAETQLVHDALYDGLTGLPNRTLFMERLSHAISNTKRRSVDLFSVLFLDLDQFKVINDSLGHVVGDQLLVALARRFEKCLRSSDTVARLGGDEFVILLENASNENVAIRAAERIQREITKPFVLAGHEVYVTSSMGILLSLADYDQPTDILRDADIAMYRAKALGKARCEVFSPTLHTQVVARLKIENELRHALENHELELYYQPIFSLIDDRLIGFEALVRWHHPVRGLLLPVEFIGIAEESGLILEIGKWILYQACTQIKTWHEQFPERRGLLINVNISGKQFTRRDFVDHVQEVLMATGLDPNVLRLEITESVLVDNQHMTHECFMKLDKLGVKLQIDDFGTGYSSLSYLQHFPVHTIKIDQSFIQDMSAPGKNSEIIRAILSMAREMGMDTTAEGVETPEQLDTLKKLACINGQGFLLSKPMDSTDITRLLEN
jgi:diguanylate cyclase (GGDEF)-like protein